MIQLLDLSKIHIQNEYVGAEDNKLFHQLFSRTQNTVCYGRKNLFKDRCLEVVQFRQMANARKNSQNVCHHGVYKMLWNASFQTRSMNDMLLSSTSKPKSPRKSQRCCAFSKETCQFMLENYCHDLIKDMCFIVTLFLYGYYNT